MIYRLKRMVKRNVFLYSCLINIKKLLCTIVYVLYVYALVIGNKGNVIFAECYIRYSIFRFRKQNWGDDLNKYLWEYVTGRKFFSIPYSKIILKTFDCYSLIGSIISFYNLDNKIIYGSGLISPYDEINGKPQKIYSLRGPLTRECMVRAGIECPEKYGDPAILLPLFYRPILKKERRGSVILNMGTDKTNNTCFYELCRHMDLNVIDLVNYNNWTDIIDEIANSKFVISESLHGLIVAETYGVPNVWVEFKNHPNYWDFKFNDYFASIGKNEKIIRLQDGIHYDIIINKISSWEKADIDYRKMLSYVPFEIKCSIDFDILK